MARNRVPDPADDDPETSVPPVSHPSSIQPSRPPAFSPVPLRMNSGTRSALRTPNGLLTSAPVPSELSDAVLAAKLAELRRLTELKKQQKKVRAAQRRAPPKREAKAAAQQHHPVPSPPAL